MSYETYTSVYTRKPEGNKLHLPRPVADMIKARNSGFDINLPATGSKGRFRFVSIHDYGTSPNLESELPLGNMLFCHTEDILKLTGAVKHFLGIERMLARKELKIIGNHDHFELWTPNMWEEYNSFMGVPNRKERYERELNAALELK